MEENCSEIKRVAVVGGGAAGMMAAITAARAGASVTVFERNDRLGKKLRITGKGRCNLTNDCEREEFLANVPTNPRFLYTALSRFGTADTKAFFEELGIPLKTERGKRVFPVSDKALDVVLALEKGMKSAGVTVRNERVSGLILIDGAVCGVKVGQKSLFFDSVMIATGGKSYPVTGSDGDGYRFAVEAGHTVVPPSPSLVPMVCRGKLCPSMQGLSLKNVALKLVDTRNGKTVYEDFGEMMFTHFGLTGPMILSASAHIPDVTSGAYEAHIDLKPALDEKKLDARILSDFAASVNKDLVNVLGGLLPQKMIDPMISLCGIDPRKKIHEITKAERASLVEHIKCLKIGISGFRPIDEAIVTKGGVSVTEVDPKTMCSKLCSHLYFAGEVLDLDAYTGGFNLQIAFSTAHLAGECAAYGIEPKKKEKEN